MNLEELVKNAGFRAGYLLPVPQYEEWTRRRASGAFAPQTSWIEGDAVAAYPWANGLLLLIWPYVPYAPDAGLSGYYLASHQSYQAMRALREALAAEGVRTERAAVPVKTILVDWGLGARLNLNFILLRVDMGIRLRDPAREAGHRWVPTNEWLNGNFAIHFGVGYPF